MEEEGVGKYGQRKIMKRNLDPFERKILLAKQNNYSSKYGSNANEDFSSRKISGRKDNKS
jgi:hypothetical protein